MRFGKKHNVSECVRERRLSAESVSNRRRKIGNERGATATCVEI